jgi:hypothetical protein
MFGLGQAIAYVRKDNFGNKSGTEFYTNFAIISFSKFE